MILSGRHIQTCIESGDIVIDPFDPKQLGPNSYNLRLAPKLLVYEEVVLDCKKQNRTRERMISNEGFILQPNILYLAATIERTHTPKHVPLLEGRSSFARLGLTVHVSAGFGDVGFDGHWTLEMSVVHPLRIYPGLQICQIFYHTIEGVIEKTYDGKYQNNGGVQASRLHTEYEGEGK